MSDKPQYFVYVLISESTGQRYTGQTDDLERRLAEHNDCTVNRRKHTSRNAGPWRLVYSESYSTRSEAMRREKWMKSGTGREWLDQILGRASPPKAD